MTVTRAIPTIPIERCKLIFAGDNGASVELEVSSWKQTLLNPWQPIDFLLYIYDMLIFKNNYF